jgi:hypothetical protein
MLPQYGEKDFRGSPRDSRLSLLAEASIDRAEDCRLFRFGLQLSRCTVYRSGGGNMKNFGVSAAMILAPAGVASAADTSADDIMVTKAAPAVMMKAPPPRATCGSLWDIVVTNCPLTR